MATAVSRECFGNPHGHSADCADGHQRNDHNSQYTTAALLFTPLPFLLWAAVRFGPGGLCLSLLEEALRRNEEALRASYEQIQGLIGRLITAQEAERTRIPLTERTQLEARERGYSGE